VIDPPRLRPEDRADYEAVLHLAMSTPDIRGALHADPTGRAAEQLRAEALDAADEITAAAGDAYGAYLRAAARNSQRHPAPAGTLVPALMTLTPLVAATSGATLLLLGYAFQLADMSGTLPGSLVTAGWILSLIAAVTTLLALTALLGAAIRQPTARLQQARLTWHQALLDRGILPHLRRRVDEAPLLDSAPPDCRTAHPDGTAHHVP
jgi:hypothetical protein